MLSVELKNSIDPNDIYIKNNYDNCKTQVANISKFYNIFNTNENSYAARK